MVSFHKRTIPLPRCLSVLGGRRGREGRGTVTVTGRWGQGGWWWTVGSSSRSSSWYSSPGRYSQGRVLPAKPCIAQQWDGSNFLILRNLYLKWDDFFFFFALLCISLQYENMSIPSLLDSFSTRSIRVWMMTEMMIRSIRKILTSYPSAPFKKKCRIRCPSSLISSILL